MIPEILKQVGPKQYDQIKGLLGGAQAAQTAAVEEDDDDVPTLVGDTNFEKVAAAKWTNENWGRCVFWRRTRKLATESLRFVSEWTCMQ